MPNSKFLAEEALRHFELFLVYLERLVKTKVDNEDLYEFMNNFWLEMRKSGLKKTKALVDFEKGETSDKKPWDYAKKQMPGRDASKNVCKVANMLFAN